MRRHGEEAELDFAFAADLPEARTRRTDGDRSDDLLVARGHQQDRILVASRTVGQDEAVAALRAVIELTGTVVRPDGDLPDELQIGL